MAIDARIANAQVSRVSFSFTLGHLDRFRRIGTGNRAASLLIEWRGPWLCVPVSRRVCPGRTIHEGRLSPSRRTLWSVARKG